jgi:hypothetical protein
VRVGGREDVDDPAAHGVLAAPLHHVGARVGGGLQRADEVVEVDAVADAQADRLEVRHPGDDRLQQRADGHRHDARAGGARLVARVDEAAQGGQAPGDRVRAGREPLVREGLPRREGGDVVGGQELGDLAGEVVRVLAGGGHEHDRAARLGEVRDDRRADALRGDGAAVRVEDRRRRGTHERGDRRVRRGEREQSDQGHESSRTTGWEAENSLRPRGVGAAAR